jgi:hypothetical protein
MSYFSVGLGAPAPVPMPYYGRIPVRLPRIVRRRGLRGFRGFGAAACAGEIDGNGNCVTNQDSLLAALETNPYLSTPAYEATQGGTTPQESEESTAADYCTVNAYSAQEFGDPLDPSCNAYGQQIAPLSVGVTLANGTPVTTANFSPAVVSPPAQLAPAATQPATQTPAASIQNLTAPGQALEVGDSWQVTVTGAPNSPVAAAATQNGQSLGTTAYGNTNSAGVFTITGSATSAQVGNWVETWSVGGVNASPISFSVTAASGSSSAAGAASTSTSNPLASLSSMFSTPAGGCFQPLAAFVPDPCIGPIGATTAGVGLLLLFFLFAGRGK